MQAITALRRLRFTGPEIAETLGMAISTVSGVLTRTGMGKLGRLGLGGASETRFGPQIRGLLETPNDAIPRHERHHTPRSGGVR